MSYECEMFSISPLLHCSFLPLWLLDGVTGCDSVKLVSYVLCLCSVIQSTECEIFLSLLVKFLDPEKPQWQRVTALEVLSKLCIQPPLIRLTFTN